MSTNLSHRHHFIPKFYLKTWYDFDGSGVWLYLRNKNGNLSLKRRPAKSIGFEEDLYLLKADGLQLQETSDDIETKFFQPIDTAASLVYQKLITSGVSSLSTNDRSVWSLFINALIERSPDRINDAERASDGMYEEVYEEFRSKWGSSVGWPRLKELYERQDKDIAIRNAILTGLVRYIYDEPFIQYMCEMSWDLVRLKEGSKDHFIISDKPVIINAGRAEEPIYTLSIALTPNLLLVMYKNVEEFDLEFIKICAATHNYFMARQAKKYLICSRKIEDSQFIKHSRIVSEIFGKTPPNFFSKDKFSELSQ